MYEQNGSRLADFLERLQAVNADSSICLSQVRVMGYASPEGGHQLNQRLAHERAESLAAYLRTKIDIPDSLMLIESAGIDWQGLDRAVGESSLASKEQVQYIIRHEPEYSYDAQGVLARSRKQLLQELDGGRTWNWMMENVFPALRRAASVVCYFEKPCTVEQPKADEAVADTIIINDTKADSLVATGKTVDICAKEDSTVLPRPSAKPLKYPIFALRSNLLMPLLNVGIELPLGNRWSLGADYYYPWKFRNSDHKDCFQLTFFSGEARYWFGKKHSHNPVNRVNRLHGHSVAAYGAWGYFDFEHDYRGHQGDFWSAGLDYVYAMPIFKDKLHLEFQIAAGAIQSHSQPYNVLVEGGKGIREYGIKKKFSYLGPTKIGISLVLPVKIRVKQQ